MASITIPNLDDKVQQRLKARASEHQVSMEEEARIILCEALNQNECIDRNLAEMAIEIFGPRNGVKLELPPRGPIRELPYFD